MFGERNTDRRSALSLLAGGGIVAAFALGSNPIQAEDKIDFDKLPKAVKEAAEGILPNAKWYEAIKVTEGEKVAFEIDGSDGKGRDLTVLVTRQGKVIEVETKLKKPDNVPEKALAAVRKRWPKFTPTETHEIRQGQDLKGARGGDYLYDMRGTVGDKERDISVQVSAEGEILESVVEVALKTVSPEALAALKKARPKFEFEVVYALREGKDKIVGYHFEHTGPKGRKVTISVTPDGTQVEVVE